MQRRIFIKNSLIASAALATAKYSLANNKAGAFPVVRTPIAQRKFTSPAVEELIVRLQSGMGDKELGWLFGNCFPNTLDTTVSYELRDSRPDTYVITGDIDAMWLRDSSAQVQPYLGLCKADKDLGLLVQGVINRQSAFILKDPYANAFYKDDTKISEWSHDLTKMQPGIHERKWEIDSLCYPIRLAHSYWQQTGDTTPFDAQWKRAIALTLQTFREQQRKNGPGPYSFQRKTSWATDGVPMNGYGYPVKPNGLICSAFRPSDDATIYMYLVPSNFFAVTSLKQAADMVSAIHHDQPLAAELRALAIEVENALYQHAIISHPQYGKIYAYEVNGYGSYNLMDDANIPSLVSLPYLGAVPATDPVYINTRKLLLSANNPFFFSGSAGEGIGGPHAGKDMIWPLGITMRALTSHSDAEIKHCLTMLKNSSAGTGFMHEAFNKDDAHKFSRPWFAWANTLFGELIIKLYHERPNLLQA